MSLTTTSKVLTVVLVIWALTLTRSAVIMLGGRRIFKKASKSEVTAYYPILNLFTMLEVVDISTFFGILLFIPGINIIILSWMSYKLGYVFNTGVGYRICLIILPIIFYPLLAFSNRSYKLTDEEYFKAIDNTGPKNLIIETKEEEFVPQLEEKEEEKEEIDSVFKSDFELKEKATPYKAVKIDLLGMEKLKKADMDDVINDDDDDKLIRPKEEPTPEKKKDMEMIDL